KTDGWIAAKDLLRFTFDGDVPASSFAQQPPTAPIKLEAQLEKVDLQKLADAAKLTALQRARVHGQVDLRISATGTLGQPRGALERPVKAEVAVTEFPLDRAAKAGLLPEGSAGTLSLSLRVAGTPSQPTLALSASGDSVSVGRLHGLAFQTELGIADEVKIA